MTDPRYPIGKFTFDGTLTTDQKKQYLNDIQTDSGAGCAPLSRDCRSSS